MPFLFLRLLLGLDSRVPESSAPLLVRNVSLPEFKVHAALVGHWPFSVLRTKEVEVFGLGYLELEFADSKYRALDLRKQS